MSQFSTVPYRVPSRRQPWSKAEAVLVLADAAASGLTLYSFGRKHGLGVTQLYRWRAQLAGTQPAADAVPLAFVPVVAAESEPAAKTFAASSGLELAVGAVTVRLTPDFCAATLGRLLPILTESRSC